MPENKEGCHIAPKRSADGPDRPIRESRIREGLEARSFISIRHDRCRETV